MLLSIFQGSLVNHLGVDHRHRYSWISVFVFYSACPASWVFLIHSGLVDAIAIVYVAHKVPSV